MCLSVGGVGLRVNHHFFEALGINHHPKTCICLMLGTKTKDILPNGGLFDGDESDAIIRKKFTNKTNPNIGMRNSST